MGAGSSVEFQDGMHVVIVGGGYGGAYLAVKLLKRKFCKVTLIDPNDASFHCMGALRAVVDADFTDKLFMPFDQMLGDSFHRGKVVVLNISDKQVELDNGDKISYTHLVIATGSNSPFPGKITDVNPSVSTKEGVKIFEDYRKEVQAAKRFVLVGGGTVGVELAGEIRTDYPDKEVTIINSRDYLVTNKGGKKFRKALNGILEEINVKVLVGERVSNLSELTLNKHQEDQIVKTESGKELEADMVIPCIGTKPNNQFFKEALADAMTEQGFLQVDEFLKVKGQEHVYAIGDINDVPEEKMAYTARLQASTLAHNMRASIFGGTAKPYTPAAMMMILPVGRDRGTGVLYFGMLAPNFLAKYVKSNDLMAAHIWGENGLKMPQ